MKSIGPSVSSSSSFSKPSLGFSKPSGGGLSSSLGGITKPGTKPGIIGGGFSNPTTLFKPTKPLITSGSFSSSSGLFTPSKPAFSGGINKPPKPSLSISFEPFKPLKPLAPIDRPKFGSLNSFSSFNQPKFGVSRPFNSGIGSIPVQKPVFTIPKDFRTSDLFSSKDGIADQMKNKILKFGLENDDDLKFGRGANDLKFKKESGKLKLEIGKEDFDLKVDKKTKKLILDNGDDDITFKLAKGKLKIDTGDKNLSFELAKSQQGLVEESLKRRIPPRSGPLGDGEVVGRILANRNNSTFGLNTLSRELRLRDAAGQAALIRELARQPGGIATLQTLVRSSQNISDSDLQVISQSVVRFFDFSNGANRSFIQGLLGGIPPSARNVEQGLTNRFNNIGRFANLSGNPDLMRGVATEGIRLSRANANRGLFSSSAEIAAARAIAGQSGLIQELLPQFTDQGIRTITRSAPQAAVDLLNGLPAPSAVPQQFQAYRLFNNVTSAVNSNPILQGNRTISQSLANFFNENVGSIAAIVGFPDVNNPDVRVGRINNLVNYFNTGVFASRDQGTVNRTFDGARDQVYTSLANVVSGNTNAFNEGVNIGFLVNALNEGFRAYDASEREKAALASGVASALAAEAVALRGLPAGGDAAGFIVGQIVENALLSGLNNTRNPNEIVTSLSNAILTRAQTEANPQVKQRLMDFLNGLNSARVSRS
jgi:hypothetical protein